MHSKLTVQHTVERKQLIGTLYRRASQLPITLKLASSYTCFSSSWSCSIETIVGCELGQRFLTKQLAGLLEVVNAPQAGMAREQGDVFVRASVHGVLKSAQNHRRH